METINQTPNNNQKNTFLIWLKTSITARMLVVGFLIIVLLIPLSYINVLIKERISRQNDVVNQINKKWGEDVLIYGPVLKLPYKTYTETKTYNQKTKTYFNETTSQLEYAYIFPETLEINSKIDSDSMHIGNFESSVYSADNNFEGKFILPNLESKDIKSKDIIWNKATIIFQTSNLKGIRTEMSITIEKDKYKFNANLGQNSKSTYLKTLESEFIKQLSADKTINFSMSMLCNGSSSLEFIPIGKTTRVLMKSDWQHPGFIGNYAPNANTKKISEAGFNADWKVLHLNRPFSQVYLKQIPDLRSFSLGTEFVILVDEYQKSERSAKYGFLVIALTFLVFFLIQTISKIYIHPFQYLMIGLALTMFYTLLVSITEHSNFFNAYIIAGLSVVVLLTLYSKAILRNIKFAGLICMSLTALYAFIYVIIQLEKYALLVGSIGLFLILATIMFVSLKIDWRND